MSGAWFANLLAALALAAFGLLPSFAGEISGAVGVHPFTWPVETVKRKAEFPIATDAAAFIAITEVYPESAKLVSYHYLVTAPGLAPFERRYSARGCGPVTYFLRVERQPVGAIKLTKLKSGSADPQILAVRVVTRAELQEIRRADRFTLMGTMLNSRKVMPEDEQVKRIAERLPADPGRNIARAFSAEIYYANRDADDVRRQINFVREQSQKSAMPVLLFFDSWWAGTPRNVPDGQGGTFGDLKYQQICYTPTNTHPADESLKKFLGDRYDPHYCLTTPNNWANTPWLTMNSPELNAYRARRLREAVVTLAEICGGDTSWIAAVALENEPRYWDTEAAEGVKPRTGERWADFNPLTVAAAVREGVKLNPADGMSLAELNWLQRNVSRYFQETVDVFRSALAERRLAGRFPLYTHTLQLAQLFPGCKINQTAADWALAEGARAGIEGMWTQPSDFNRVREWGAWCNLNREETDGQPIERHLWDLRTAYAMGGELFNSFNWHLIKPDAYFNYAREFLTNLPVVTLPPARAARTNETEIRFVPNGGLQAFTRAVVPVKQLSPRVATVALSVAGGPGRECFSQRQPLATSAPMTFEFPAPAEASCRTGGALRLYAYDASGAELSGAATFAENAQSRLMFSYDLEESRALSRLVIAWQPAATAGKFASPCTINFR